MRQLSLEYTVRFIPAYYVLYAMHTYKYKQARNLNKKLFLKSTSQLQILVNTLYCFLDMCMFQSLAYYPS